jgi:hypothetical protein
MDYSKRAHRFKSLKTRQENAGIHSIAHTESGMNPVQPYKHQHGVSAGSFR